MWRVKGRSPSRDSLDGFARSLYSSIPVESIVGDPINEQNLTVCYYEGYRESEEPFDHTLSYWENLFARAIFFILYEHAVFLFVWLVCWIIPDQPKSLKDKIKRENYLIQELLVRNRNGLKED